jgi:hypothetical protein
VGLLAVGAATPRLLLPSVSGVLGNVRFAHLKAGDNRTYRKTKRRYAACCLGLSITLGALQCVLRDHCDGHRPALWLRALTLRDNPLDLLRQRNEVVGLDDDGGTPGVHRLFNVGREPVSRDGDHDRIFEHRT